MLTIWKLALAQTEQPQWFELPVAAMLLHVEAQLVEKPTARFEQVCVWARVDTELVRVQRGLVLRDTGTEVPDSGYVGTALLRGGRSVRHVFDLGQRELGDG